MKSHSKASQSVMPTESKRLMALITFLFLVPLVYFIPDIIEGFLPAIKWLNVVAVVAVIVPIMSYGIMPIAHAMLSSKEKGGEAVS